MKTGTVKWFNNAKGFGFISPDEGGQDLFVHYSDVQMQGYRNLTQEQRVSYVFNHGPKGPAATQVVVLDGVTSSKQEITQEQVEEISV